MLSQSLTRAAPTMRTIIQRRQFSIVQQARAAIKNFEPLPFQGLPTTTTSQAADWKPQFVKLGRTASW
ncbi:hypothetical protein BJ875DRAFT_471211 [Amylocarpus encephaloides]|uniref:Uncharacterized protein n=1 Tax=Amylocarpus encephaloides TaxID=45428 RepID=A0A9P7YBV3_9HELO|nr:hypothetical protein BJ875DRAFT_471211 [Amylocarpus encephaloides]